MDRSKVARFLWPTVYIGLAYLLCIKRVINCIFLLAVKLNCCIEGFVLVLSFR